jgi:hypothetical protein
MPWRKGPFTFYVRATYAGIVKIAQQVSVEFWCNPLTLLVGAPTTFTFSEQDPDSTYIGVASDFIDTAPLNVCSFTRVSDAGGWTGNTGN